MHPVANRTKQNLRPADQRTGPLNPAVLKNFLLALLSLFIFQSVHAQVKPQNPWIKLSTLHVYEKDLLVNLLPPDSNYSFSVEILNEYPDTVYTVNFQFDPQENPSWKFNANDTSARSANDSMWIQNRRLSSLQETHITDKSMEGSVSVYYYIVHFTVDSMGLPSAYNFLKYCKATAYIHMPNKDLEKIVWENTKGFRFVDIDVSSFHLDVYPEFINGKYRVLKEWMEITGERNGKKGEFHNTTFYKDYRKL